MDEQHIDIFSGEKRIGHIVTPGGTVGAYCNVIQICGFDEAFDYWGCGLFGTEKDVKERDGPFGPVYTKSYDHKRDIQLIFSEYDAARTEAVMAHGCAFEKGKDGGCFNDACTCDNKDRKTEPPMSPYAVKHHRQVEDRLENVTTPSQTPR